MSHFLTKLNQRNSRFWAAEIRKLERRITDPQLYTLAMDDMAAETVRLPVRNRKTIEKALEDAEQRRARIRESDGSKGGRPRKGDALQEIIEAEVARRPDISAPALLERLRALQHGGAIEDIDDEDIWFTDTKNRSRRAPISGLKDRLSRALKLVRSRKPVPAKL